MGPPDRATPVGDIAGVVRGAFNSIAAMVVVASLVVAASLVVVATIVEPNVQRTTNDAISAYSDASIGRDSAAERTLLNQLAADVRFTHGTEQLLLLALAGIDLLAMAGSALVIWRQHRRLSSRVLTPLREISIGVTRAQTGTLGTEVKPSGPPEIRDIAIGLNDLLRALRTEQARTTSAQDTVASIKAVAVESARLHQVAESRTETDPLTGLFNRRRMLSDLDIECQRSRGRDSCAALMLVDLDGLRAFNNAHGRRRGDEVVRRLGAILSGSLRRVDTVYRFSGEQFGVLLRQAEPSSANALAESLRARVEEQFNALATPITASFGVALLPADGRTSAELTRAASRAVRIAKERGRNRVVMACETPSSA